MKAYTLVSFAKKIETLFQICYQTSEQNNSFLIKLNETSSSTQEVLAMCSVNGPTYKGKKKFFQRVTCFTSVVRFLKMNDIVFLHQNERERLIMFENGQSFLGMVQIAR